MQDNSSFTVTDLSQGDLKASIQVVHTEEDDFDDDKFPDKFQIIGASSLSSSSNSSSSKGSVNDIEKTTESKKRKAKDAEERDSEIIDTGDDIIVLDDIDVPLAKKQKVVE